MFPRAASIPKAMAFPGFLAGTALILDNSFADFRPGGEKVFITQRGAAATPLWVASLYLHVAAGMVCLPAALPLVSSRLLRRCPALHRICGRIYAVSVLLLLCPTGIHLAFSAKGGLAGQSGFLVLGIATFATTILGVSAILNRDLAGHRRWMTRSLALVASAIAFRVYHVAFFQAGLSEQANYIASLWLSILGNAAIAEWALSRGRGREALPTPIPSIP